MNEVRFNPPSKQEFDIPKHSQITDKVETKNRSIFGKFLKIIGFSVLVILVITLLFLGGIWAKNNFFGSKLKDSYSAVFLNNGQVYFGKIVSMKKDEIVLNEVFYLQVSDNVSSVEQLENSNNQNQTRFNLVKLGTELHGPTDEMYINRNQIIFYEYLREDSSVVESIRNYR